MKAPKAKIKRRKNTLSKTSIFNKSRKDSPHGQPEKKKNTVVVSISQVFRNLSISVNLTVYTIYLLYLIYSIYADVGVMVINITLALVTAAFMAVYLVLRLSTKRRGKQLKQIKHYYKNFKLVARTVSAITAVYALVASMSAVSPLAIIIAFLGAVFLVIRLIVELILSFIRKKLRSVKDNLATGFRKTGTPHKSTKTDTDGEEGESSETNNVIADGEDDDEDDGEDESAPKRRLKRRGRKVPKYRRTEEDKTQLDDFIVPVDQCLLNDIDE